MTNEKEVISKLSVLLLLVNVFVGSHLQLHLENENIRRFIWYFARLFVTLTSSKIGCISEIQRKNSLFFGISLNLDKFLTLKNANKFVFSSLNRNFALSLQQQLIVTKYRRL